MSQLLSTSLGPVRLIGENATSQTGGRGVRLRQAVAGQQ